jgi:hypothetical protein
VITDEGDEMKIAAGMMSNWLIDYGTERTPKPQTLPKAWRVCHPERPNQSLGVNVLEWYQPTVVARQQEKCDSVFRKAGGPALDFVFRVPRPSVLEGRGFCCRHTYLNLNSRTPSLKNVKDGAPKTEYRSFRFISSKVAVSFAH